MNSDLARNHPNFKNSIVAGIHLGEAVVSLRDNNVGREDAVKSPSADLHIVAPSYITIDIDPHSNWNVIIGQTYNLHISVFDSHNHKLFPSANLVAELEVEEGYFESEYKTENGTWVTGQPLKVGSASVSAVLIGVKDIETGAVSTLDTPLRAVAQMEIFEPIQLDPPLLYFPWDPVLPAVHQISYAISGHESTPLSSFVWSSMNASVATVTQNGVAKTTGQLGDTKIVASMNRANHNRGEAQVFIVPVAGLEFLRDQILEVQTGSELRLPLSMWGDGSRMFHQCHQVDIQTALADKSVAEKSQGETAHDLPENACTFLAVRGLSMGFSRVTASYNYELEYEPIKIKDSLTIGVYDPLKPVQPTSGNTVVAVGSSVDIVWSGGPQPWILSPESHFHKLTLKDTSLLDVVEQKNIPNNFYVYSITCNQAGETTAVLKVGNKALPTLAKPVVEESVVNIVCGDPEKLQLTASPGRPEGPCPMMAKTGRIAALCYEDLRINVSIFDAAGRKFDNYSSLDITWQNSDETLGDLQIEKGTLYGEQKMNRFYRVFADAEGYQMLQTKEQKGQLDITATLRKSSYLMGRTTTDVLELKLVQDAEILPPKLALFDHADNFADISVAQGSGYFRIQSSELGIASYQYSSSNKTIHLSPVAEGATILKAVDLCLKQDSKGAKALVNVIGIQKVELKMVDKVQLNNEFQATVQLWDQFGDIIDIANIKNEHLEISVSALNKEIALIENNSKKNTFTVKGAALGQSTLTATASYGKRRVVSNAMPLQVFPPLELEPKNITLIIGAKFQVQVLGGPGQKDSNIEFSMQHGKIANADGIGLIDALTLGSTTLTAKAIGTDRITGQKLVLSSDKVEVHVVKLNGLKIKSPITKMRVGTEIPLSLLGLDEKNQNSFAFASALPHLNIEWKLNNQEVAKLEGPLWRNGLSTNTQNSAVMRLLALKPGRVMIKVHATITKPISAVGQYQFDRDMEFTHQLEIIVFDDLKIKSPHIEKNTLLMGPTSEYHLKTNRDGVSGTKISFQVLDSSDLITVTRTGRVISKRNLGTAVVLVRAIEDNSVVQELSITVQVKSVTFLMLNALPVIDPQTGLSLNTWPLGVKLPLEISYHDESGVRFDAVSESGLQSSTVTRPNRFDTNLLKTEKKNGNESMSIELVQSGFTVLRTICGQALDDFLVFNVESGIVPAPHQIGVGDVLLLESVLQGQGKWSAQPNGVIHIDADSGVAMAARTGLARISYKVNSEVQQSLNVEITKASKITFVSREQHLTNQVSKVQSVAFNIMSDAAFDGGRRHPNVHYNAKNVDLANNLPHAKTLFSCKARFTKAKMDISNIFKIQPGFFGGSYGCLFTSLDETPMFSDDIEVTVTPTAGLESLQAQKISVPFSSTVKMLSASTISLTNVSPQNELILSGMDHVLDAVIVTAGENHFMFVGRAYAKDENTRAWPIGLKSAFWTEAKPGSELSLEVSSALTGQSINIPVKVAFRGDQCANIELGWSSLLYFMAAHYQSLLFILASCVICVFVTRLLSQAATKPSEPKPNNAAAANLGSPMNRMQNGGSPSSTPLMNADNKPYLWTVNDSPVYGSPVLGSSPYNRKSPRSLTQYSYTER